MNACSTRDAAKKLGIDAATLSRYISSKKIPAPKMIGVGKVRLHVWTDADIERVRALLPKIPDGRKTRHVRSKQKKQTNRKSKP